MFRFYLMIYVNSTNERHEAHFMLYHLEQQNKIEYYLLARSFSLNFVKKIMLFSYDLQYIMLSFLLKMRLERIAKQCHSISEYFRILA